MNNEKYNRQTKIAGWDQKALETATIGIVTEAGNMLLARNIALLSASLGIGTIKIDYVGSAYEYELIANLNSRLVEDSDRKFLDAKIIIDATNNDETKEITAKNCAKAGLPFASVCSSPAQLRYAAFYSKDYDKVKPKFEQHLDDVAQNFKEGGHGAFTSLIAASMALDRIRREIFSTDDDKFRKASMRHREGNLESLIYNLCSKTRFDAHADAKLNDESIYASKNILLIGAGGVGVAVAKGMLDSGAGNLTILDPDNIKVHNLNRQFFYANFIGKNKAEAVAESLNKYGKRNFAKGIPEAFNFNFNLSKPKPDLIIASVDNNYGRMLLNEFSLTHEIPLVETATMAVTAAAQVCSPPHTCCLRHTSSMYANAKEDFIRKRVEIARKGVEAVMKSSDPNAIYKEMIAPVCSEDLGDPSVVMPTVLAGGLALSEGQVLFGRKELLVPARLLYNTSYSPFEFKVQLQMPKPGTCSCKGQWPEIPENWPDMQEDRDFYNRVKARLDGQKK